MKTSFELLLVKDKGSCWEVQGITYSNAMMVEPDCATLRATLFAIEECKNALKDGKRITISKTQQYAEVQPSDLVIGEVSELEKAKLVAINEISARLHQGLFAISIVDLMDYLNCFAELFNAGYCITDSNREDKYFEVIEASQEIDEPQQPGDDASFEQQQEYTEKKARYDNAQQNLTKLEKYLNSYDKLSSLKSNADFLTSTRKSVEEATSTEEVEQIMKIYRSNVQNRKMTR